MPKAASSTRSSCSAERHQRSRAREPGIRHAHAAPPLAIAGFRARARLHAELSRPDRAAAARGSVLQVRYAGVRRNPRAGLVPARARRAGALLRH
ncbi:MAG: hypothetical protein ACK55I_25215, partial [bacterium]